MIIGIDHGNYAVKTANHTFKSGISEYKVKPPFGEDILEYKGSLWMPSSQRISYMEDKTADERFFVLTLIAIAKELRGRKTTGIAEIDLAVGLPPGHFGRLKNRFKEYFSRRELITFKYMNEPFCISIGEVFVMPQAYSAATERSNLVAQSPWVFILDFGGFTTDYILIRDSRPDLSYCDSLNMGVIPMFNEIISKAQSQYGLLLSEDHIQAILKGEPIELDKDIIAMIHKCSQQHINGILSALHERSVDLKANPVIFVGGGAILFQKALMTSKMVGKSEFVLNANANAIGYEKLAAAKKRKISAQAGENHGKQG